MLGMWFVTRHGTSDSISLPACNRWNESRIVLSTVLTPHGCSKESQKKVTEMIVLHISSPVSTWDPRASLPIKLR